MGRRTEKILADAVAANAADLKEHDSMTSVPIVKGPNVIPRDQHPISRKNIESLALRVLYKLHNEGYDAYLVGGAVQDFLQGTVPKDYDIATNATPEQLRRLFRNSRIIGRRFRLVHVFMARIITRSQRCVAMSATMTSIPMISNRSPMIMLGVRLRATPIVAISPINALYYDIDGFSILDYCGGVQDLRDGVVRAIGDPVVRFREDRCECCGRLNLPLDLIM